MIGPMSGKASRNRHQIARINKDSSRKPRNASSAVGEKIVDVVGGPGLTDLDEHRSRGGDGPAEPLQRTCDSPHDVEPDDAAETGRPTDRPESSRYALRTASRRAQSANICAYGADSAG